MLLHTRAFTQECVLLRQPSMQLDTSSSCFQAQISFLPAELDSETSPGERFSSVASPVCYLQAWGIGWTNLCVGFRREAIASSDGLKKQPKSNKSKNKENRIAQDTEHIQQIPKVFSYCDKPFFASGLESRVCSYMLSGCRSRPNLDIQSDDAAEPRTQDQAKVIGLPTPARR